MSAMIMSMMTSYITMGTVMMEMVVRTKKSKGKTSRPNVFFTWRKRGFRLPPADSLPLVKPEEDNDRVHEESTVVTQQTHLSTSPQTDKGSPGKGVREKNLERRARNGVDLHQDKDTVHPI